MNRFDQSTVIKSSGSLLSTHAVLRNTYLLLSLTLLFSACCAAFAVWTEVRFSTASSILLILLTFGLMFATIGLRHSGWGILAIFAFTGCMGYGMGPMLNHFIRGYQHGGQLILTALAGTGVTFLVSSFYVLFTKKDLSFMGKGLFIGIIVCIVASLANYFLKMPAMQMAISTLLVFISSLYLMYDTSRILHNGETNYIMATIALFIDIMMLFQNLLMLLGLTNNRN